MKRIIEKSKAPRWQRNNPPYQVGVDDFEYRNIERDLNGYINAKTYRPFPYDLVKLKTKQKEKSGWWTGIYWDGYRLMYGEEVLGWKLELEEINEKESIKRKEKSGEDHA